MQHPLRWRQHRTHPKHCPDTSGSSEQIPLSSCRDESNPGCPTICHPHTHTTSRTQGCARTQRALHSRTSLIRFLQDLAVKGNHKKLQGKIRPNKHLNSTDQLIPLPLLPNTSITHTQGEDVSPNACHHSLHFLCDPICCSCKF